MTFCQDGGKLFCMKKLLTQHILPHRRKNRFYNHATDVPENFLTQTIPSFIQSLKGRRCRLPQEPASWVIPASFIERSVQPLITWLGHATFLIQVNNINILTDPVFGHASWLFPRLVPLSAMPEQLPPIDLVLLSHNHPDHASIASLRQLKGEHVQYAVPMGDRNWLIKHGFEQTHEYQWWEQESVALQGSSLDITFLPACHWSQRGLFDRNKSLWGSWMIQSGDTTLYFAGDTAYWHHFQAIRQEFSRIDAALLPIGPCEPQPWMQRTHMNVEQALMAFHDLDAHHFFPMHWGTFPFGTDDFDGPFKRLHVQWQTQPYAPSKKLIHAKIGQTISFEETHV